MPRIVFIIWPFLGVVISFFTKKKIHSGLLYPFFFLIGYSFILDNPSSDLYSYYVDLQNVAKYSLGDYFHHIATLYTEAQQPDLYAITLMFLITRFTSSIHFFMGIVAVIQLHFMLRFFVYLYNYISPKNSSSKLAFWIIVLMIPINTIYGVRFWTAFFIFLNYSLRLLVENRRKHLIPLLLTPLVHFAFIIPLLLIPFYMLLRKYSFVLIFLILIGIYFGNTVSGYLQEFETSIEGIEYRKNYLSEDEAIMRKESVEKLNFYVVWNINLHFYYSIILIFIIYTFNRWKQHAQIKKLMPVVLISLILAALFRDQGSVARYGRFFDFFSLIVISIWLNSKKTNLPVFKINQVLLVFIFSLKLFVGVFRGALMDLDYKLIFSNAFLVFYSRSGTSVSDVIFFFAN